MRIINQSHIAHRYLSCLVDVPLQSVWSWQRGLFTWIFLISFVPTAECQSDVWSNAQTLSDRRNQLPRGLERGFFSPQNIKTTITHFHAEHNVISVQYGSCAEIKMHKLTAPLDDFIRCLHHLNWLEILSLSSFSLIPIWHNYHHCMKVSTIIQNSSGMLMRSLKTVKIMWNYHPLQRLPISPQSSYTKAQSLMKMTSGKVLTTMATPPYPTTPLAAQLVRKLQHARTLSVSAFVSWQSVFHKLFSGNKIYIEGRRRYQRVPVPTVSFRNKSQKEIISTVPRKSSQWNL